EGAERIAGALFETRYGKWVGRLGRGRLGLRTSDGEPIAAQLAQAAGVTGAEGLPALGGSGAVPLPLGGLPACPRRTALHPARAGVRLALHALPSFWAVNLLARVVLGHGVLGSVLADTPQFLRFVLAVVTLGITSVATVAREQRSAMLEVL